jgi:hypothetical protein
MDNKVDWKKINEEHHLAGCRRRRAFCGQHLDSNIAPRPCHHDWLGCHRQRNLGDTPLTKT